MALKSQSRAKTQSAVSGVGNNKKNLGMGVGEAEKSIEKMPEFVGKFGESYSICSDSTSQPPSSLSKTC